MQPGSALFRMPAFSRGSRFAAALALIALLCADGALAASRKARGLYRQGREAELAGEFDRALELYSLASSEAPRDHRFSLAERRVRFVAGQAHVDTGLELRSQGRYEEALTEFERAVAVDPSSSVAIQEHGRTLALIEKRDEAGKPGEPPEALASVLEAERYKVAQRVGTLMQPPELAPLSNEPINLMLNEKARIVFETLGKLAGINMLFDPDFSNPDVNIELRNATLPEALDYVSLIAKSFWKPLTSNTVLVTDDNQTKRREYEDRVVKTVYLTNLATPQDLMEVVTAIRGITQINRIFPLNSLGAIVMRGSPGMIAVAEKIIHDMDKPRPEVIIDVLVLETNKSRMRTLGFTPLAGTTKGARIPLSFQGTAGAGATGGVPLNRLGDIGSSSWSTSLPNFVLSALFSNSDTELLQSPRVRAADNQQADLRIGDRIPVATGSFQPGVGGVGINPLVNTQFNYEDVGVNVALTPKIHANRDVSMHVEIEISNVSDRVDIGGISQPVIGQRTIVHDIRVREGEASIIGGLNQSRITTTRAGLPVLGQIPVLGRFFSEEEVRRTENEILLVLVPHIVRMPGIEETNLRTIASGTEAKLELRYEQTGNGRSALPPLDAEPVQGEPPPSSEPAPRAEPPLGAPGEPEDAPDPSATDDVADTEPREGEATAPAAEPPAPRFLLEPANAGVAVGQEATVSLRVGDAVDLVSMPMRIQYDREKLQLMRIEKGQFLAGDDASDIIFSRSIRHSNGLAAVNLSRFPGTGGANGEGELVTLTFKGLAPGQAQVRVFATGPRNAANAAVRVEPLTAEIAVQ